ICWADCGSWRRLKSVHLPAPLECRFPGMYLIWLRWAQVSQVPADHPIAPAAISPSMRSRGLMFSKQLIRILAAGVSAVVVLGGGTFALASGSPPAPGAGGRGTTLYACVVTHGAHARFPWRSLWKTSTHPVTCPRGQFSVHWTQA